MLFYVYFGNINSAVMAKIPVSDVSWGLLGKIGHFRQGRTNIGSAPILYADIETYISEKRN